MSLRKKILLIICSIVCLLLLSGCKAEETNFDIKKYISITELGYDTYGSIEVLFDYDKFFSDFKSHLNKKEITREDISKYIDIQYTNSQSLSNGQSVAISIKSKDTDVLDLNNIIKDSFDKDMFDNDISYVLTNLKPLVEYNPFDDLLFYYSGFHGSGTIYAHIEHYGIEASWEWPVIAGENNGTLSNGDIVTLLLDINKEEMERKYGVKITEISTQHKVSTLISYLESGDDLDKISEENIKALNKVVEDWVVSGENDENKGQRERTYSFETAILLTKASDSRICFIYHIEDGYVPGGYYVYFSPIFTVLVDNENDTLITGDKRPLSNSFAKYEKDTVRYTENWGWGQYQENQGFLYNDIPYAGKQTLEDMIEYLSQLYDSYDTMYRLWKD